MSGQDSNIQVTMKPFQDLFESKEWIKASQWLENNRLSIENSVYFYNQGVVSYKLNELPLARFYFEKAISEGMEETAVYKNLNSVKQDLGVESIETPSFFDIAQGNIYSLMSQDTQILIWIVITLIFIFMGIFKKIKTNFYYFGSIVFFVSTSIIYFFVGPNSKTLSPNEEAIIIKQTSLYEGPSAVFEQLGSLPPGLKVKIEQSKNEWAKIIKPQSVRGWIKIDNDEIKKL